MRSSATSDDEPERVSRPGDESARVEETRGGRGRPAVAPEAGEASSAESRLRQTAMADRVGQSRSSG